MTSASAKLGPYLARHPVLLPVLLGGLARVITAWVSLGFFARDDYFHVLVPALRWLQDPTFDWDATDLPGAGIRSHLVPRVVWLLLRLGHGLGMTEPEALLRLVYLAFGLYSLLVIPPLYLTAARLFDARSARLAALLGALHFAMPYVGTRLLIEAMAMPPLMWGMYLCTFTTPRRLLGGGLLLGLACWFRFQVGVAAVGVTVAVLQRGAVAGGPRAAWAQGWPVMLGGTLAVLLQGLFDQATTGDFLGPVWRNLQVNLNPHAELSRSNPLAYLGLWLLLTAPPATVWLVPGMVLAARRAALLAWPFVLFFVSHSAVPHKEERFMLPVLPIFLVLLAAAPAAIREAGGWLARTWPWARGWLVGVHVVALGLAITSDTQANLRQAMVLLRHDPTARALISLGPEVQDFFLARPELPKKQLGRVDAAWLHAQLTDLGAAGVAANRFLAFAADRDQVEMLLAAEGLVCDAPVVLEGWWLDRLTYKANPRRNRRRSPVLLWRCEQPALATVPLRQTQGERSSGQPPGERLLGATKRDTGWVTWPLTPAS